MPRAAIAILVSVLLVAGCGGSKKTKAASAGSTDSAPSAGSSRAKTLKVSETEFSLSPARLTLAAPGTYTIEGVNDGATRHAIAIEGKGLDHDSAPAKPGQTATLKVTISEPGTYELYCPIANHRAMGMEAKLVVRGARSNDSGGETSTDDTGSSGGGYGGY